MAGGFSGWFFKNLPEIQAIAALVGTVLGCLIAAVTLLAKLDAWSERRRERREGREPFIPDRWENDTLPFIAFFFVLFMAGCASPQRAPVRVVPLHVAPSTTAVAQPIAAAGLSRKKAADSIASATASTTRAATIAKKIREASPAAAPESIALEEAIDLTAADLFHASAALQENAGQLAAAETNIATLDARLSTQTAEFNATENRLAESEARAMDIDAQRRTVTAERDKLKRTLFWSRFKIWGGFIGAVGLVAAAFALKIVGAGSRLAATSAGLVTRLAV